MYKGLALAELGRYQDAIAALDQATRILPDNFVFPMYLGCIHLDEGQAEAAAEAFGRAAALAPTNHLVASYKLLADYVKGDKQALECLVPNLVQAPDGFKARLLLASADWTERVSREPATTAPESAEPPRPAAVSAWLQRLRTATDQAIGATRKEAV